MVTFRKLHTGFANSQKFPSMSNGLLPNGQIVTANLLKMCIHAMSCETIVVAVVVAAMVAYY